MTTPLHSKQTLADGIHSAISYQYTNDAARSAATGFTAEDLYKLAYQTADNAIWCLVDTSVPSWVRITSGSGGETAASFLVLSATGSLSNERVFSVSGSSGLILTDSGGVASLSINDNVVATLSGSNFSGPVTASLGINMVTQSIQAAKTIGFAQEYDNGNCGGATSIDWTRGQKQVMTLTASITATFLSGNNPPNISNYLLRIVQGSSGGPYTIQWPASAIVKWAGAAAPTISSGANKVDIVTFYYNGNAYYGVASLNFA